MRNIKPYQTICPVCANVKDEFGDCALCLSIAGANARMTEHLIARNEFRFPSVGIVVLIIATAIMLTIFNVCNRPSEQPANKAGVSRR